MPTKPKTYRPPGYRTYDQARPTAAQRGPYCTKWWKETRKRIARRDLWQCVDCGKDVGQGKGDFHCDHNEERPVGAPIDTERWDRDENLRTLCDRCHNRKTRMQST